MSGGHFDYNQYRMSSIEDEISRLIESNNVEEQDQYGYSLHYSFSPETLLKFEEAVQILRRARVMVQRIDWLV